MSVELISHFGDDLMAVNAARVFGQLKIIMYICKKAKHVII